MKNKGFTLIELVIVIVILGILAATAAPKFLDLSGDARESVIKGVGGSINSAADIVHAKALIESKTGTSAVDLASGIEVIHGWPTATADGIGDAIDLSTNSGISQVISGTDWVFTHDDATGDQSTDATSCKVVYKAPTSLQDRPVITILVEGC